MPEQFDPALLLAAATEFIEKQEAATPDWKSTEAFCGYASLYGGVYSREGAGGPRVYSYAKDIALMVEARNTDLARLALAAAAEVERHRARLARIAEVVSEPHVADHMRKHGGSVGIAYWAAIDEIRQLATEEVK